MAHERQQWLLERLSQNDSHTRGDKEVGEVNTHFPAAQGQIGGWGTGIPTRAGLSVTTITGEAQHRGEGP